MSIFKNFKKLVNANFVNYEIIHGVLFFIAAVVGVSLIVGFREGVLLNINNIPQKIGFFLAFAGVTGGIPFLVSFSPFYDIADKQKILMCYTPFIFGLTCALLKIGLKDGLIAASTFIIIWLGAVLITWAFNKVKCPKTTCV